MAQTQAGIFEFAISQQHRHPPSRRFFVALALSCLSHFVALSILIEYPQLLGPGLKAWLRRPIFFQATAPREQAFRLVAVLPTGGGMKMPSASTLKQNMYDFEAHRAGAPNPPIRVKWNGEIADNQKGPDKPLPALKPVPGTQEPKPSGDGTDAQVQGTTAEAGGASTAVSATADKGGTTYLPPPQPSVERPAPKKPPETAGMVAPTAIPGSIKPPPEPAASKAQASAQAKPPAAQVFENEQKAIISEGSGIFGAKGFPMGDYASEIIERIKGNWFIPSNLRKSQGRTTVIFYIDKDGRYTEARIVASSGVQSLDLAALNAIIGSNPFPPLPKGFPGDHVGAKFVFSYNERP